MFRRVEGKDGWLVVAVIVLLALAMRMPGFGDARHDYDEQLYHLVGLEMLKGHMPYIDIWDRKPFGLFAIFAFTALVSGGSVLGYQLLAAAAAAVGAIQTYVLGRRFGDPFACLVAAFSYLIVFPLFAAPSAQSEVFYIPLLLGMLQLTIAVCERDTIAAAMRPALAAMALGGIALQIKYTVVPQCLLFGLVILWRFARLGAGPVRLARHAAVFAALGIAPTALVAAGYALAGHLDTFVYANFTSIFARGILTGFAAENHLRWITYGSSWLWFVAAIGMAIAAARGKRGNWAYWLVAAYVAASVAAVFMIGNIYTHYFIPPATGLALLAVPAFSASPLRRFLALNCIALAVAFAHFDATAKRGDIHRATLPGLAAQLRPYVDGTDRCLYIFEGPPALYQATGGCIATRYVFPDHLNSALELHAIGTDPAAEMRRMLATRPGAIVSTALAELPMPNHTTAAILRAELARNYTRISGPPNWLWLYVRNDQLRAGRPDG